MYSFVNGITVREYSKYMLTAVSGHIAEVINKYHYLFWSQLNNYLTDASQNLLDLIKYIIRVAVKNVDETNLKTVIFSYKQFIIFPILHYPCKEVREVLCLRILGDYLIISPFTINLIMETIRSFLSYMIYR